jgi:GT2 family glycosyltransferase
MANDRFTRSQMSNTDSLSLGVSIVLYRTPIAEIQSLLDELLLQGAERVYLVDNSPLTFDTFGSWQPPERVLIIRTGMNTGYGRGHNIAIRDSVRRHRFHLVSNPDIHLGPLVLPTLTREMERRPDVGLMMPEIVGTDGVRHYMCKRSPSPLDFTPKPLVPKKLREARRAYFEMRDQSYDREMDVECLSGCFMFFRSTVLQSLDGFDEQFFMYMEDFDLSRRARRIARNVYYPHVRVVHEHRRAHRHSIRLLRSFGVSLFKFFNRWGWLGRSRAEKGPAPSGSDSV